MPSRIEELERRVHQDPASIAFGALAEEYRRAGRLEEAVAACRSGLERHPSYLSARVTLGRALQDLGQHADARAEFEYVLSLAPDNLAAIRGLAELHGGEDDGGYQHVAAAPPLPVTAPTPSAPAPPVWQPPAEPEPIESAPIKLEPIAPKPAAPKPLVLEEAAPAAFAEPDFAALDASIAQSDAASAAEAERAAQIERLEIWLARIEQAREAAGDPAP